eukprot:Platyproteum_vivax@DN3500_c0_g1_i1.p1
MVQQLKIGDRTIAEFVLTNTNLTNPNLLQTVKETDLEIVPIGGGITNVLYRIVNMTSLTKPSVMLRIYGPKTEEFIDRNREKIVLDELNKKHFGKKIYSRHEDCQIEEWIHGAVPTTADLKTTYQVKVAEYMADLHSVEIPSQLGAISTDPLWDHLWKWFFKAKDIHDTTSTSPKVKMLQLINFDTIENEMRLIQPLTKMAKSPIVMCHNDVMPGNILIKKNGAITLIDYEYCCPNHRGFDIANYFIECVGTDCDWSKFPSEAEQLTYLRAYIAQVEKNTNKKGLMTSVLWEEVQCFLLVSHLYWGLFALIQARISEIDFPFFDYAVKRISALWLPLFRDPLDNITT